MSVAVIGNPKVNSRTRHAAELVVAAVTGSPPDTVIELSELGPGLLGWGDPAVAEAKQQVLKAGELLVVATPTYKGTYTGLLKLFLDRYPAGALTGVRAVPVAVAGSPDHAGATAADLLRLLRELGAVAASAVAVLEAQLADGDALLDRHAARLAAEVATA